MTFVHVQVRVKPEFVQAFQEATLENAAQSAKEPGIAAFDVLRDLEDPTHFVLVEVYRSVEAPAQHKQTAHYQKWRDAVAPMMTVPRTSARFQKLASPE